MTKTPSVAYCTRKIRNTKKQELYDQIENIPMSTKDYVFLSDIIEGLDNGALAAKHKKSSSRISQWKRRLFEQLHQFDLAQYERRK